MFILYVRTQCARQVSPSVLLPWIEMWWYGVANLSFFAFFLCLPEHIYPLPCICIFYQQNLMVWISHFTLTTTKMFEICLRNHWKFARGFENTFELRFESAIPFNIWSDAACMQKSFFFQIAFIWLYSFHELRYWKSNTSTYTHDYLLENNVYRIGIIIQQ